MFKTDGHTLVDELQQHVTDFHAGLDRLEERLRHRFAVVKGRISELEDENNDIRAGLEHIKSHRP